MSKDCEPMDTTSKRIGFWWSDRKSQKLNTTEFKRVLKARGYDLIKLDLDFPLASQGPFLAIVHKLSDVVAKANNGDTKARKQIDSFEDYVKSHPQLVVLDHLEGVRILMDRYKQYKLVEESDLAAKGIVFTPNFVELTSSDIEENAAKLKSAGIKFPIVCKPVMAHGSTFAHQMSLVFCVNGLGDIRTPCVAQSFINHDARLFKVFVVKDRFTVIERPSLKNFGPGELPTIHFDSHEISKPDSSSALVEMDQSQTMDSGTPSNEHLEVIVKQVRTKLGLTLFGIDVILEKGSGRYAIIDMNVFPGYDGMNTFFEDLADLIVDEIKQKNEKLIAPPVGIKSEKVALIRGTHGDDSGIDTSDSCDEKKSSSAQVKGQERVTRLKHVKSSSLCEPK